MGFKQIVNQILHNFFFNVIALFERILYYSSIPLRPLIKSVIVFAIESEGIKVNGDKPWDLKLYDDRFFSLLFSSGYVGAYDAYLEKYIEIGDIELFYDKLLNSKFIMLFIYLHPYLQLLELLNATFDVQTIATAWKDGGGQYDISMAMYKTILGPNMVYSCLNYDNTDDVSEAELAQLEFTAKKLKLKPGMKVLDIGCGFGALAEYLASHYDVHVTGVTVSKDMAKFAADRCKKLNVNIELKDYRELEGKFDRVTCIEMSEHVGAINYGKFIKIVSERLKEDGIFFLQAVTINNWFITEYNPIFEKHLQIRVTFPHIKRVVNETSRYFVIEHIENIGYNCGISARNWFRRLQKKSPEEVNFSERQHRNYCLYFAGGAMLFLGRHLHIHQLVLSKNGVKGRYIV